jgi:hypothetical protein
MNNVGQHFLRYLCFLVFKNLVEQEITERARGKQI